MAKLIGKIAIKLFQLSNVKEETGAITFGQGIVFISKVVRDEGYYIETCQLSREGGDLKTSNKVSIYS